MEGRVHDGENQTGYHETVNEEEKMAIEAMDPVWIRYV